MDARGKAAAELITLLEEHREEIADSWLVAIREETPAGKYSQRPAEEIRTNNLMAQAMLIALLSGSTPDIVWELGGDRTLGLQYADLGIEVSEMVVAILLLSDVVEPILRSTFAGDVARGRQARSELHRHIRLLARTIVGSYADVTDQHLHEQQEHTALMLDITRTVGRSLDLDQVLRVVASGIAAAAGAEHCLLFLLGDNAQTGLFWAVTDRLPPETAGRLVALMARPSPLSHESLMRSVVDGRKPLACYDARTDPRTHQGLVTFLGFRSVLEIPFVHRGQVLAVAIVVTFDECRHFTDEQIELATGIARAVAPAIENARLYQQVEEMAVLEERARLAREIHDDVAQTLGALQLRASILHEFLSSDRVPEARAALDELQDLISTAYGGVRESVFDLRAMAPPADSFLSSLQEYVSDYRLHYGLDVSLEADAGAAALLDRRRGVQVIRIVQEALANARRHARASHARICIEGVGDEVHVCVEDDGQGFDPSTPSYEGPPHFGLQVMRERADKVCGSLVIDSRPGEGTRVEVRLPGRPPEGLR